MKEAHTKTLLNRCKVIDSQYYKSPLLKKYSSFLSTLHSGKMESVTLAAEKYTSLFKGQDTHVCDSAFFIFDKYYRVLTNTLEDLPSKDTTVKYDSLLTDSIGKYIKEPTGNLAVYALKLKTNGFKVYLSEGENYINQDLDFVAKWFYGYVSNSIKYYLSELNKEDKKGYTEDAGLTISPVQLIDRTVWWEKFKSANPNSILTNRADEVWKDYLGTSLTGMDNTPVFDFEGKSIDGYFKTAYTYLQYKYPTSQTNKYVKPYFKLLLQQDHNKADKLIAAYKRKGLIQ
jgi:hypothetical protein